MFIFVFFGGQAELLSIHGIGVKYHPKVDRLIMFDTYSQWRNIDIIDNCCPLLNPIQMFSDFQDHQTVGWAETSKLEGAACLDAFWISSS